MTDSESDLVPSLVNNDNTLFTFQNESTAFQARGPKFNSTSFHNNKFSSSMNLPINFGRQRYEEQHRQHSIYYRRETSPMSIRSASDMQPRNFPNSRYPDVMTSMYNGRAASPMSVRSIDSSASMSAADIAMAFKNVNFNKYELRMIKDAYNKFMKHRMRKRIEKRRNLKAFIRESRRKSGYDSREGSVSSISSDDCRSTRTGYSRYTTSLREPGHSRAPSIDSRSLNTNLSGFRRTIQQSNMYKDCTDNFRNNSFHNLFSHGPRSHASSNYSTKKKYNMTMSEPLIKNDIYTRSVPEKEIFTAMTQKDRFKMGYLLPSHRFNNSSQKFGSSQISEKHVNNFKTNVASTLKNKQNMLREESESDEEIFSETVIESDIHGESGRKRPLENVDAFSLQSSVKKKTKLSSPLECVGNVATSKENNTTMLGVKQTNDFEFRKPFPARKSNSSNPKKVSMLKSVQPLSEALCNSDKNISVIPDPVCFENRENESQPKKALYNTLGEIKAKDFEFIKPIPARKSNSSKPIEVLISKSKQPLSEAVCLFTRNTETDPDALILENKENEILAEENSVTFHSVSDISKRPSFMKRKLFTQTLDVTESKNLSSDSVSTNSPQNNGCNEISKDKHRIRKLAAGQSCLSREVNDENNLMDLIHKIVPADHLNSTVNTNKSVKNNNKKEDEDKWDITSVISTCKTDNISETFTDDDEIFGLDKKEEIQCRDKKSLPKTTLGIQKNQALKENSAIGKERSQHNKQNNVICQNKNVKPSNVTNKAVQNVSETDVCKPKKTETIKIDKALTAQHVTSKNTNINKIETNNQNDLYKDVESFWNTDVESDMECCDFSLHKNTSLKFGNVPVNSHKNDTSVHKKPNINYTEKVTAANQTLKNKSQVIKSHKAKNNNSNIQKPLLSPKETLPPKTVNRIILTINSSTEETVKEVITRKEADKKLRDKTIKRTAPTKVNSKEKSACATSLNINDCHSRSLRSRSINLSAESFEGDKNKKSNNTSEKATVKKQNAAQNKNERDNKTSDKLNPQKNMNTSSPNISKTNLPSKGSKTVSIKDNCTKESGKEEVVSRKEKKIKNTQKRSKENHSSQPNSKKNLKQNTSVQSPVGDVHTKSLRSRDIDFSFEEVQESRLK